MKIVLEIQEELEEDEIYIRCRSINTDILELQNHLQSLASKKKEIVVYKEETEYYLVLDQVLFFETSGRDIMLHTSNQSYQVKQKLYELESMLPDNFVRISKSTIVNVTAVYAITRNSVTGGVIQFANTHKQISVSRSYYKNFKYVLEDKRR